MTADRFPTDVDQLVTGEAVALELPPASVGIRLGSGLIDLTIQIVLLIVGIIVAEAVTPDEALGAVAVIVVVAVVIVLGPATLETLTMGRTVGKLVLGTRTVRDDAGPISFHHAFIRALVGVVEIWVFWGVPALVTSLVNSRGKRLGDLVAGTYVVRDKIGLVLPAPAPMPPQLAHWAHAADIAPLPEGLAISIRQLLGRGADLSPDAWRSLVVDLADRTLAYVAPAPPLGTPPEQFLAAVAAERRERDRVRLHTEADLRHRLAQRRTHP